MKEVIYTAVADNNGRFYFKDSRGYTKENLNIPELQILFNLVKNLKGNLEVETTGASEGTLCLRVENGKVFLDRIHEADLLEVGD